MIRFSIFIYKLELLYFRLKTLVYYRLLFKKIGPRSIVSNPLLLFNSEQVSLGSRVLIRKGLRLEVLVRPDERLASVSIGDHVNIEQNCHIICQNKIVISENVSITGNCAIVDTTHPYTHAGGKTGSSVEYNDDEVYIGSNVFVGFGSIILPGTRIGANSYVGAMSVVKGQFPEKSLIYGSPARVVRSLG